MSISCNRMFYVFHIYVTYVSSGCFKSRSVVAYVAVTIHVWCKCIVSYVCCKCFYLDVAYVAMVIHICCKCMFQLFQTYVASV
jgi:hypothetical protein